MCVLHVSTAYAFDVNLHFTYLDNCRFYSCIWVNNTIEYSGRYVSHTLHHIRINLYVGKLQLYSNYSTSYADFMAD